MTERFSTKKLVLSALFAALACVATMSIRIPTPGTGGYIHPGDAIVILCGVFLDPVSAFLAAGIGSCMAFSASHVCGRLRAKGMNPYAAVAGCGVIDIILVAGGYCLCEIFLYGLGAALASVPSNLVQGAGGLIIACALYPVLRRPLETAMAA